MCACSPGSCSAASAHPSSDPARLHGTRRGAPNPNVGRRLGAFSGSAWASAELPARDPGRLPAGPPHSIAHRGSQVSLERRCEPRVARGPVLPSLRAPSSDPGQGLRCALRSYHSVLRTCPFIPVEGFGRRDIEGFEGVGRGVPAGVLGPHPYRRGLRREPSPSVRRAIRSANPR